MFIALLILTLAFGRAWAQAAPPANDPLAQVVSRFDAAIAGGFPARLELPVVPSLGGAGVPPSGRVRRAAPRLTVTHSLDVAVQMPGLPAGRLFVGQLDDENVVLTRIGPYLDITRARTEGVDVVGYTLGSRQMLRDAVAAPGGLSPGPVGRPPAGSPAGRTRRAIEDPHAFSPTFHVFIHDDVQATPRRIHAIFVAWWLADVARKVLPTESLRVVYRAAVPGVTDMPYGYPEALENWQNTASAYAALHGLPHGRSYKHKFLLLTRERPMKGANGVAYEGGAEAMASIRGRVNIVAHEFGHTLAAMHADAERRGPLIARCITSMWPGAISGDADCYRYSDDNGRNIRHYLRHGPDPAQLAARGVVLAD
jgi:hypothetical protein